MILCFRFFFCGIVVIVIFIVCVAWFVGGDGSVVEEAGRVFI